MVGHKHVHVFMLNWSVFISSYKDKPAKKRKHSTGQGHHDSALLKRKCDGNTTLVPSLTNVKFCVCTQIYCLYCLLLLWCMCKDYISPCPCAYVTRRMLLHIRWVCVTKKCLFTALVIGQNIIFVKIACTARSSTVHVYVTRNVCYM